MARFKWLLVAAYATLAVANPLPISEADHLQTRQTGINANDIMGGSCKDFTLIFVRGTWEAGNMGAVIGPPLCATLKEQISPNRVACQGVDGMYSADIPQNFLTPNTDAKSIASAATMLELATTKCPKTQVVAAGYSQGSAVIDYAIQEVKHEVRNRIQAVALFGFSRNIQDRGGVPGYPQDRTKVYCAPGDVVCDDILLLLPPHYTYSVYAKDASDFFASKVNQSN
ncbi:cutinase-domain-containing protein [Aspergillus aculeatinus CBS 121060]|uniref:Cutinase-domain-containing protein n=1 Tax=Aspergillus aculeatinus CBS 121060 TaxID=1448322 RepID=A0ACD1H6B9_9EURO|nr:cutinase-domain-containing protein [Aspergillus aculeatinus CBS 121060]RAH69045.1 cutinase-domain-containing protein [Aspergillus aculeatinus CBS 121060]